ncbi:GNAT family N-acetyltransferase [Streptomyces sp. 1331.2]|uniref:GNAT family N-acetyltransferase n=1 Tax=Streptomyces sp. 1331.2 TaxID=1938835 RepID=UPI000BD2EC27|nr:GNAT family N-acetyltransferase [Streptomyces sp. 1331.2]SOB83363.1 Protein N-acetyltransferase, RimJ/RimL family [Streptomyces sp. 1331.2]
MMLRDVRSEDVEAYVRMRCDPVMMAELGGPLSREQVEARLRKDVVEVAADRCWAKMIVPDGAEDGEVAGAVMLWPQEEDGAAYSEIGWMVLPEYQGRGLAKTAVRRVLDAAAADGRWGEVHANPGATNGPSNGICRALGFRLLGERDLDFAGRTLRTNHWVVLPGKHTGSGAE